MSEMVTLVNRSSKTLHGVWDGRHYDIAPGPHSFSRTMADKFREQNPVMGSENKYTLEKQYLLGIEEVGQDTSPIEQTDSITLENLTERIKSGELKVVRGHGLYSNTDRVAGLPLESGFMTP